MSASARRVCGINIAGLSAAYEEYQTTANRSQLLANEIVCDTVGALKSLSTSVGLDYDAEFSAFNKVHSDLWSQLQEAQSTVSINEERANLLNKQLELSRQRLATLLSDEQRKRENLNSIESRVKSTRYILSNTEKNSLAQIEQLNDNLTRVQQLRDAAITDKLRARQEITRKAQQLQEQITYLQQKLLEAKKSRDSAHSRMVSGASEVVADAARKAQNIQERIDSFDSEIWAQEDRIKKLEAQKKQLAETLEYERSHQPVSPETRSKPQLSIQPDTGPTQQSQKDDLAQSLQSGAKLCSSAPLKLDLSKTLTETLEQNAKRKQHATRLSILQAQVARVDEKISERAALLQNIREEQQRISTALQASSRHPGGPAEQSRIACSGARSPRAGRARCPRMRVEDISVFLK